MEENLKVCVDLLDQSAFIRLPLGMHHLLNYVVPVRLPILFFFYGRPGPLCQLL